MTPADPMETQRFLRLRELFDRAMQLPPEQRHSFAEAAAGDDAHLHEELVALLNAPQQAGSPQSQPTAAPGSPADPSGKVERIGPYRILKELGKGGMGVVYLAVRDDGTFTKKVALKLIREGLEDHEVLHRFRAERQVLASLEHPNIARILDGGNTQTGAPYYVMEFIEGESVDLYCARKALDIEARVRLFQQVCSAVAYLHWKQILHRDLKPSNILVTPEGQVKLIDFGIAKVLTAGSEELTSAGRTPLTPAFASPEQLAGKPLTPKADIYSLGVILYLLLTGSQPNWVKLIPPSAALPANETQTRRKITADLDQIVLKALDRDPDHRYETPAALAEDLQRYLEGRTVVARPVAAPVHAARFVSRNPAAVLGAVLVLLLAIAGAFFAFRAYTQQKEISEKEQRIRVLLGQLSRPLPSGNEPSAADAILDDLRKLRENLQGGLAREDSMTPSQRELRRAVITRSAQYLESLGPLAGKNPAVAREVGYAYVALGEAQQSADRAGAVASYTAAAKTLATVLVREPDNSDVRARLSDVEQRLTRLEARVPPDVNGPGRSASGPETPAGPVPTPAQPVAVPDRGRQQAVQAPAAEKPQPDFTRPVPAPPPVQVDPSPAPAPVRRPSPEFMERMAGAESQVEASQQAVDKLKKDLEARGLAPRSDTLANVIRMKSLLQKAQSDAARGDFASAESTLSVIEALAARVARDTGH